MANQPFHEVVLTENDVPGAKFCYDNLYEHTNDQLKRWLECRGLVVKGNKDDLVKRCVTVYEVGLDPWI